MTGHAFHIRTPAEEFSCPQCGEPVQADRPEPGEPDFSRAWMSDDGRAYCSRRCARRAELAPCAGCGEATERGTLRTSTTTGARICEACVDDEDQDAARYDPTCYGAGMHWDGEE